MGKYNALLTRGWSEDEAEVVDTALEDPALRQTLRELESEGWTAERICCAVEDVLRSGGGPEDLAGAIEELRQSPPGGGGSLPMYFREVGRIYDENGGDWNIDFRRDSREKVIAMNLKTVISIAKRYQGMGLSLDELISAGNVGLVEAYDVFDPDRNGLLAQMERAMADAPARMSWDELSERTASILSYGQTHTKFQKAFRGREGITPAEVMEWGRENIHPAKFNSVAAMRITAAIKAELTNYSAPLKKQKPGRKQAEEPGADDTADGAPESGAGDEKQPGLKILRLDSGTDVWDCADGEDASGEPGKEARRRFWRAVDTMFGSVREAERRIWMKSKGLFDDKKRTIHEISAEEGVSPSRVSQILQKVNRMIEEKIASGEISRDGFIKILY